MSDVWLPLVGPDDPKGRSPKAVSVSGWQHAGYYGVSGALYRDQGIWLGLRLDDYIVVDCDDEAAKDAWLAHIGQPMFHTLVRKTPHGYHFFYERTVAALSVRPQKLTPKTDLKAGVGHQVVYQAPGYSSMVQSISLSAFNPAWVPEQQKFEASEEWSEMPEGIGDNSMLSFAGTFRRWGMDVGTIAECLTAINQLVMTKHPMPQKSIRRIARQVAKYNPEDAKAIMCPHCGEELETR